jgi:dolichol-phosphate mannosyltransferase
MFVSMTTMHQLEPMHNNPSVSIIIPTYNERDYIYELLERIQRSVEPLKVPYEIIIVDDDSLDETWNVASHYSDGHPVRVIQRKGKKGRAAAILEGIIASNYIIVVVMGADLQHPPEILPKLIESVSGGADIAIGSRFAEPGAVQQRGLFRRTVSRGADLLARTAFRKIRSVKDVDSGFFAFRKEIIAHANLNPVGNKILLEILVLGNYKSVSEIAYSVDMRTAGACSLGVNNTVNDLHHLSSLFSRSGELHRFLKFCTVGAIGAVVNLLVLYALTEFGVFYLLSGLVGIEAGLLSNFVFNRSWTFKDRGASGLRFTLTALYRDHAVRFVGIILNLAILWLLTSLFGIYYLLSQLIGITVAMLWNYGGNQWWTWEPS